MAVMAVTVVSAAIIPERSAKHYKNLHTNKMIAPAPRSQLLAILAQLISQPARIFADESLVAQVAPAPLAGET